MIRVSPRQSAAEILFMNPETNLLQDLLLLAGGVAHRYRYNGGALLTLRIGALLMILTTIYFALLRPLLKRITDARLARLIEEHSPGIEDRFVTAVEYSNTDSRISPAIVHRLYQDANSTSAMLDVGNVIRRSRLMLYGGAAL